MAVSSGSLSSFLSSFISNAGLLYIYSIGYAISSGGTIFHHQKPAFTVLESKAVFRRTANFTIKGYLKGEVPYYSFLLLRSLSQAFCYRVTLN